MDLSLEMISDAEFGSHMEKAAGSTLVVVVYFLKDSLSCKKILPIFRDMAFKFQSKSNKDLIQFIRVDADRCRGTVQRHNINVMPTFVLYKNMTPLKVIQGAHPIELESFIRQELGNSSERIGVAEDLGFSMGPGGLGDLYHFIDPKRSECLNASDLTQFQHFIHRKSRLESDCDAQLILVYGFNQPVKIKSLRIKAPNQNGPKTLKLFINQVASLDFDDVNQFKPTQEISLKSSDLTGDVSLELNQTRFRGVTNLHIFIPENMANSELSELTWLTLYRVFKRFGGLSLNFSFRAQCVTACSPSDQRVV